MNGNPIDYRLTLYRMPPPQKKKKKPGTVDTVEFPGLCSDQKLSFFPFAG